MFAYISGPEETSAKADMQNTFDNSSSFGLSYALNRRKFIKLSAMYSTSLLVVPALACKPSKESLRFGLLADSHYAQKDDWKNRRYDQSLAKTEEAVRVMNEEQVDFLLHLGDFKDEGNSPDRDETLGFLDEIEAVFQGFEGPTYHAIGNHDVDSITKADFLQHVENTGIPKDQSYYSFDLKGFHCVVLDANYHKDGSDQYYAEGADWQDPNIPQAQLDWLKDDLEKTELPTIVFCHHPLYEFRRNKNQYHVNNFAAVQEILEASRKVMVVFQGHVHAEEHSKINGIHYITQLAMVDYDGLENNSFSIVEIKDQQIRIDGFKRVSDQVIE